MILLRNLIWIWTVSYVIVLWWVKANTTFLRDFYENKYNFLDYNFYVMAFYVVSLIGAPIIVVPIVVGEAYVFFKFLPRKIIIWFKIWGLKDRELRMELRKKLRNL